MIWLIIGLLLGFFIGVAGTIYARPLAFSEEDVALLRKLGSRLRTNETSATERVLMLGVAGDIFAIADRMSALIRHKKKAVPKAST